MAGLWLEPGDQGRLPHTARCQGTAAIPPGSGCASGGCRLPPSTPARLPGGEGCQQALNLILKNSTSILIAHRLSTVKAADRIVVMRKGTIIEEGSHEGLLNQNGHYAELYNTYFRHQSLAYVEQMKEMVGK